MTEPIDIARRLADVQDRLLALPPDAFAQRWELRAEQEGLREEAHMFSYPLDEDKFDDELLAELGALREQMKRIERQRIDLVGQSGSSGASTGDMSGLGAVRMNMAMDDAAGLHAIKARIGIIKGVLVDRAVPVPEVD